MSIPSKPIVDFNNTAVAFAWKNDTQLRNAYKLFRLINNKVLVSLGTKMTSWAISIGIPFVESAVKHTIFDQFCGGEDIKDCQPVIELLADYKSHIILDYGVEARQHEIEFEQTAQYLIHQVIRKAVDDPNVNILSSKLSSLIRFALMEKVSANEDLTEDENAEYLRGVRRVKFLCKNAFDNNISVYFDAEESWIQPCIDDVVTQMQAFYNRLSPIVFNTVQLYRINRIPYLKESFEKAQKEGYILAVKLVRGAYMEKERVRAEENNYESPIQPNKEACDADYNTALEFCVENIEQISFCNATHNEDSCQRLIELIDKRDIPRNHHHCWTGQLYGMSDHLTFNMAQAGFNVAKYLPFGPVKDVIPYLIRRANENTSVSGQMSRELNLIDEEIKRRDSFK